VYCAFPLYASVITTHVDTWWHLATLNCLYPLIMHVACEGVPSLVTPGDIMPDLFPSLPVEITHMYMGLCASEWQDNSLSTTAQNSMLQ
jgi:hypothetical protein